MTHFLIILVKQLVFLTVSKTEIIQHLCRLGYSKPSDWVAFSINYSGCYYSITIKPVRDGPEWRDALQNENKEMVPDTKHVNTLRQHYKAGVKRSLVAEHQAAPITKTAAAVFLLSSRRAEGRGCHFLYSGAEKKTNDDQLLTFKLR